MIAFCINIFETPMYTFSNTLFQNKFCIKVTLSSNLYTINFNESTFLLPKGIKSSVFIILKDFKK